MRDSEREPKSLEEVLKEHMHAPNIAEQIKDKICFMCGTPFHEKEWEEHRKLLATAIRSYLLARLPKEKIEDCHNSLDGVARGYNQALADVKERLTR